MALSRLLLKSLRGLKVAPSLSTIPSRSFSFSSAEEAANERRRRKRRLRIEPPLNVLRQNPQHRPPHDPRQPDSTSALVGHRLNLHNRVQSLIRANDLDSASAVARQAVFSSTRPTVFTCNALVAAFYRNQRYDDSIALFHYFFKQSNIVPNVVSYNFLILSYCESENVDKGIEVYKEIIASAPFSPSYVTYRNLTKGLVDAGRIDEAVDYLREMINKGNGADSLVFNNLILGFLNLGNLDKAVELFDELKERCTVYDGVVTATFMDWFFKQGRDKEAMEFYRELLAKEFRMVPATCNVLLETLLKHKRTVEAWALFDHMLDSHTPPTFQGVNSETFNIMVNEHCRIGKVSEAIDVFKRMGKKATSKPFSMDVAGFNNIITRYCEHEMMEDAEKIYGELCSKSLNPDVTTYRTLIDAYFKVGMVEDALQKYIKMVEAKLRVIPEYANKWFGILIENGKVSECAPILTNMGERDPKPDCTTYELVIRAMCNENNLDASIDLVGQMLRYGIGVTSSLKEFLNEAFGKVERLEELEKIFTTRGYGSSGYSRPTGPPGSLLRSGPDPRPPGNYQRLGAFPEQIPTDSRYSSNNGNRNFLPSIAPPGNFQRSGPFPEQIPTTDSRYNSNNGNRNYSPPIAPPGNFQRPGPFPEQIPTDPRYNSNNGNRNYSPPIAPPGNFQRPGPFPEQIPTDPRYNSNNANRNYSPPIAPPGNFQRPGPFPEQIPTDSRYNSNNATRNYSPPIAPPGNLQRVGPVPEQVPTDSRYDNNNNVNRNYSPPLAPSGNLQRPGPVPEQVPSDSRYDNNAEVNRNYSRAY